MKIHIRKGILVEKQGRKTTDLRIEKTIYDGWVPEWLKDYSQRIVLFYCIFHEMLYKKKRLEKSNHAFCKLFLKGGDFRASVLKLKELGNEVKDDDQKTSKTNILFYHDV